MIKEEVIETSQSDKLNSYEELKASLLKLAATAIRATGFQVILVNVREGEGFRVITGTDDILLGTYTTFDFWNKLLKEEFRISQSYLVPPWHSRQVLQDVPDDMYVIPDIPEAKSPEDWDPYHFLIVPLLDSKREVIGFFSVDEPVSGKVPSEDLIQDLETFAEHAALAIEKFNLINELSDRVRQVDALYKVSKSINNFQDSEAALRFLVDTANELLHADFAVLLVHEPAGDRAISTAEIDVETYDRLRRLSRELLSPEPTLYELHLADGTPSSRLIGVCVRVGPEDGPMGVLGVFYQDENHPKDISYSILSSLAEQAFTALRNRHLYNAAVSRADRLRVIQSIASRLNRLNDVRKIAKAISEELRQLVDFHACRIFLASDEYLVPAAVITDHSEYSPEEVDNLRVGFGEGITGWVAQHGEPALLHDAAKDTRTRLIPGTNDIDESMLAVPIKYDDRVVGVITLSKVGLNQFDNEDLQLLVILADQAAIAIENAKLVEKLSLEAEALRKSEERNQLISRATNDAIWDWDLSTNRIIWNDAIQRLFGYEADHEFETSIEWWEERCHPDDIERLRESLYGAINSDADVWAEEYRFRKADGSYAYVLDRGYIVRDASGKAIRAVGSMLDITHRIEAAKALRESEERFKAIFEDSAIGMALIDQEGRILKTNKALTKILGYTQNDLIEKNFLELVHPDHESTLRGRFTRIFSGKNTHYHVEQRYIHKDGHEIWGNLTVSAIRSHSGDVDLAVCMLEDITSRKQADSRILFQARLLDQVPVAVIACDMQMRVVHWNSAASDLFGYTPQEAIGKEVFELASTIDKSENIREVIQVVLREGSWRGEVDFPLEDRVVPAQVEISAVRDKRRMLVGLVAVIVDLSDQKKVEERLRRQNVYLSALHEIALATMRRLDPSDVFRTLLTRAAPLFNEENGFVYLEDDDTSKLRLWVGTGVFTDYENTWLEPGEGVSGRVWRTGKPVILKDYISWPHRARMFDELVFHAVMAVPIFLNGRSVGSLGFVSFTQGKVFSEDDLHLLHRLADLASIALENSRLYQQLEKELSERLKAEEELQARAKQQAAVAYLGQLALAEDDQDSLLRKAADTVADVLDVEYSAILRDVDNGKTLVLEAGHGWPEGVIGSRLTAAREGHPPTPDKASFNIYPPEIRYLQSGVIRSAISVGIGGQSSPYGLLCAYSLEPRIFSPDDINFLQSVSNILAAAIEYRRAAQDLMRAEARYRKLVEQIPAVTYIEEMGMRGVVSYISPQVEDMLGYTPEEWTSNPDPWSRIIHPDDYEDVATSMEKAEELGIPFRKEYRMISKSGEIVWVRDEAVIVRDAEGQPLFWQGVLVNITDKKKLEDKLAYQAFHDALTGLPNRALFMDRLKGALARAKRYNSCCAVLFLDLDRFKHVNDSLGHQYGDQLLIEVGNRLLSVVRSADTVARRGGDEFTILLEPICELEYAKQVAERVIKELEKPFLINGQELYISTSIGIALSNEYSDAEELIHNADVAMYWAKSRGRARYEVYDLSMSTFTLEKLKLESELRRAVQREEFSLVYQPVVRLRDKEVVALEALLRWHHPERGLLLPDQFLKELEDTGLIMPLTDWMLREVCRQHKEWQKRVAGELPLVSVNFTARQFQKATMLEDLASILQDMDVSPSCLQLEITETVAMDDAASTARTMKGLKDLGVKLALDDVGTGYSSLSYLRKFPLDVLKVDRTFVMGLGVDPDSTAIVHALVMLAKSLGMLVTAEGVEKQVQVDALSTLGCDLAQGYFFSRPMEPDRITDILVRHALR
ncbi:diguanylate cyclase/phosphodiesterase with PAS/PAC and GAF sensor(s) [Thermobaculum terrenum ATCC BAA-798]|uniref:Diguanylate cyclase/phosphodiesterase with PAS/PAC and GAF sensor(S) n=1 Tax=Thermobaculum terrenum (strain ATCC BAA-798 / CCMEE 7001 / YNP1) TaxID=525904 RepID=D1CEK7_THET1|nr:PAS domain S-box protein [Thermobaculum terrenum]ACZ41363.1 diguanylate cyclase/phosphodiesterase with PAS/PAC and GAF sensor(s) [Thermobaculum terrenum ATCC BAA-798]